MPKVPGLISNKHFPCSSDSCLKWRLCGLCLVSLVHANNPSASIYLSNVWLSPLSEVTYFGTKAKQGICICAWGGALRHYLSNLFPFVAEHAGHAYKLARKLELDQWYGIVIVSGDGLIYEVQIYTCFSCFQRSQYSSRFICSACDNVRHCKT